MPKRITNSERVSHVLEVLREHTGEHLTIMELAEMCDMAPGKAFGMIISAVRHVAADYDEIVTRTLPNRERGGAWTLRHLMPGAEDGTVHRSVLAGQNDAATRVYNTGRQAAWLGRHAESNLDRRLGRLIEIMSRDHQKSMIAVIDLAAEIRRTQ